MEGFQIHHHFEAKKDIFWVKIMDVSQAYSVLRDLRVKDCSAFRLKWLNITDFNLNSKILSLKTRTEKKIKVNSALGHINVSLVVTCERDLQMQRLMESRQMTERESGKLIDVQMSLDQKAALANYVVENSGNFQDLKSQVNFILLL